MPTTSSRLLALLSLLQSNRDWSGQTLSDRLQVSTRTVRRDIDRLRELGYRIATVKGPDGGYRLDAGSTLPPLLFDDDQALALAVSLQQTAHDGAGLGAQVAEGALRALTTVRQLMPARVRRRLELLPITVSTAPRGTPTDPRVLTALGAAVNAREVLRFDYALPGSATERRRCEPHHLINRRGRWYLLAWDLDREDWRTFRADRIAPRTPTGPRFSPRAIPGGDAAAFISARFRGAEPTDPGWPCQGEVIVSLPAAEVAPYSPGGLVEIVDAARCRLREGSWSWAALAASLCRFDADLEVVGPSELREAFAVLSARAARATSPDLPDAVD